MALPLSEQFLADLRAVAPQVVSKTISQAFLTDLAELNRKLEAELTVSDDELQWLGVRLTKWRVQTQEEVERLIEILKKKNPDDPLLCPISLFGTMDYGRLETAHTRTLAWLLDPKKEHGFGTTLMEALLTHVTTRQRRINVHRVLSEHGTGNGRIDVYAEGDWVEGDEERTPWRLVIEAKIGASEGEEQLSRYEDWLDRREDGREVVAIFLTLDGRRAATENREWVRLKFQELAEIFRLASASLRTESGYHFLRFYLAGVLHDVCDFPKDVRSGNDPYSVFKYLRHVIGQ